MAYDIVPAVPDPHPDRAGENLAAIAQDAVLHHIAAGVALHRHRPEPNPAGPEIVQHRLFHPAAAAAIAEPDPVNPGVPDLAVRDHDPLRLIHLHHRLDRCRRLARLEATRRTNPARMPERQPADLDVLHLGIRLARDHHELLRHRHHDL